jgi:hypothetical protein
LPLTPGEDNMSVHYILILFISEQLLDKMPRSNKNKHFQHQENKSSDVAIKHLLSQEKSLMISRAIESANKHGIKLKHGSANPGLGDCAFEAVIQNNNDRQCFREKLPMSISWYRRIWVTDMANRTVNSSWNILGQQKWLEGWQDMLVAGTYERGIFGDLMLPGIACGIKKILLIFNTNLDTPHDPIYVIDPRQFDVNPDSELPIVLAYNMSHYESMTPSTEADIQLTGNLVKEYSEGRYKYGRQDLSFFLEQADGLEANSSNPESKQENHAENKNMSRKKNKQDKENDANEINLEEIDDFLDKNGDFSQTTTKRSRGRSRESKINLGEVDDFLDSNLNFVPTPKKRSKTKANGNILLEET